MTDPNILDFTINDIDASIANSLRRIMISQIPSIVIDNVCIKENDCSLSDEIIVHRLGQIPLRKTTNNNETVFEIKLCAVGPRRIYSRDIVFSSGIQPVDPDIIILNLDVNECIDLFGNTEEGTGIDHAKFSVCCGTSYKKLSDDSFKFHIEVSGVYSAKETFNKALDILREEILMYKKML